MACPGPPCGEQSVSASSPSGSSFSINVGQTFIMNACWVVRGAGGFEFCADCLAILTLQFKKSTDSVWTQMTSNTANALSTADANPQDNYSSNCDVCDESSTWTVSVNSSAAGFTWNVRVLGLSCASDTTTLSVPALDPKGVHPAQLLVSGEV